MLKNYLISAIRHLLRYRSVSLLNILGLSMGIAICVSIFIYVRFETSYDDYLLPQPGPIQFDETGENVNARPVVMQVQDGAVVQVWPTDLAESTPRFPCTSWNR